jgi:polyketide cyclase/dehydrase/lipid transport protein
MNEFDVVTVIECPVEEVFSVVEDVTKTPLWGPGVLEVRRTSEGPLAVRLAKRRARTAAGDLTALLEQNAL